MHIIHTQKPFRQVYLRDEQKSIMENEMAVREDRMRGGRNKLGVYYKQDRAARSKILQQSNTRSSSTTNQQNTHQQLMIYANGLNFYENNNSNNETTVTRSNPYANETFSSGVKAKRAKREVASTYGNSGLRSVPESLQFGKDLLLLLGKMAKFKV
uniref:Uncharacterized protein n=1 Tax=Meloidogyne floridensis TaxID=298350 RepID=A0A915NNG4_9BILA